MLAALIVPQYHESTLVLPFVSSPNNILDLRTHLVPYLYDGEKAISQKLCDRIREDANDMVIQTLTHIETPTVSP